MNKEELKSETELVLTVPTIAGSKFFYNSPDTPNISYLYRNYKHIFWLNKGSITYVMILKIYNFRLLEVIYLWMYLERIF